MSKWHLLGCLLPIQNTNIKCLSFITRSSLGITMKRELLENLEFSFSSLLKELTTAYFDMIKLEIFHKEDFIFFLFFFYLI